MSNANIEENNQTITATIQLSPGERKKLKTRVTGHGKMIAAAVKANVSRHTIYNAMYGKPLSADTYSKITQFLTTK